MSRARLVAPLALVVAAGVVRFWRLGTPDRIFFDETYYASDAHEYLTRGVEATRAVHPPLGKWLIAAGIEVVGFTPIGWRVAVALAGTLTVGLTFLAARRLLDSDAAGLVAGALVATDGLSFSMSRIAMLDAFLAMFTALAAWAAIAEVREVLDAGHEGRPDRAWWVRHRWWLVAGAAGGAAVATKWSGLLALGAAVAAIAAARVVRARRDGPTGSSAGSSALRSSGSFAVCFVVVPAAIYLVSYTGWFTHYENSAPGERRCDGGPCEVSWTTIAGDWWSEQLEIVERHNALEPTHPYRSEQLNWLVGDRPVLMYVERCPPVDAETDADTGESSTAECVVEVGQQARITGSPSPVLWWAALGAYVVLAWALVRRRHLPAAVALWLVGALYLPWHLSPIPGFVFYMTPVAPVMAIAVAAATELVRHARRRRILQVSLVVLSVATFAWAYPVLSGVPLDVDSIDRHLAVRPWP